MPSTIYWPQLLPPGQALPCPQREGHSYARRPTAVVTRFGVVTRSRRIYADSSADLGVSFVFSASESAYFEGFFTYVLADGTRWFWLPILVAGVMQLREVNFDGQMPSVQLAGIDDSRVIATVSTRRGTQMTPEEWDNVLLHGSMDALYASLGALEIFVNQDGLEPLE